MILFFIKAIVAIIIIQAVFLLIFALFAFIDDVLKTPPLE